jgi:PKHD-type hydroxylase
VIDAARTEAGPLFTPVDAVGADWRRDSEDGEFVVELPPVFDAGECGELVRSIAEFGQVRGAIGTKDGRGELDLEARRARQTRVPRAAETDWVYERLGSAIDRCNQEHFHFDLRSFEELAIIDYRTGDFYDWHQDAGPGGGFRKLSVSVMLSAPEDYEGGGLSFPGAVFDSLGQGDAVVFASFLLHGVQPVKRGRRCALVGWVEGPAFR